MHVIEKLLRQWLWHHVSCEMTTTRMGNASNQGWFIHNVHPQNTHTYDWNIQSSRADSRVEKDFQQHNKNSFKPWCCCSCFIILGSSYRFPSILLFLLLWFFTAGRFPRRIAALLPGRLAGITWTGVFIIVGGGFQESCRRPSWRTTTLWGCAGKINYKGC